jgi:hypothetical protein
VGECGRARALPGNVRVYAVGDRLADRDGTLRRAYRGRPGTVAVLRPDGYLGLLDDDPATGAVRDYLTKIGLREPGLVSG